MDFGVAVPGAYFADEVSAIERESRLTLIRYDEALPVYVGVDLGHSDLFVAHFVQTVDSEHRVILTKAYQKTAIPQICLDWKKLPFPIELVILPHDAEVTDLTSGQSREKSFNDHVQGKPRQRYASGHGSDHGRNRRRARRSRHGPTAVKDVTQLGDVSLAEIAVYYKPQIEAALEQGGNAHSFDDVVRGILNGELHLLPLTEQSCAVLELRRYPKLTCYHVFLAAGRLEDL